MTQRIFRKLFPKSMILNKIWNFVNSGNDPGEFPETFSRYWKKFPEKPLSHDPFLGKNIFSWASTHEIYLEINSGKSPESRPKIAKSGKCPEKVSLSHRPFIGNSFRVLPIWVKLRKKNWSKTARKNCDTIRSSQRTENDVLNFKLASPLCQSTFWRYDFCLAFKIQAFVLFWTNGQLTDPAMVIT